MAMKELFSVLTTTFPASADASWRQGAVLLLNTTTGQVQTINRTGTAAQNALFVGFSADNTAKVATEITPSPSGSNYLSGSTFVANNNGYYVGLKRSVMLSLAGDTITNPTNLQDLTAAGNATPRRGCSVFSNGGRFITDMLAWDGSGNAVETSAIAVDNTSGTPYTIGDLLTWSAGTYAGTTGFLVRIASGQAGTCRAVARLDSVQLGSVKSNGLDNTSLFFVTAL
jgi:hypothetical protein